MTCPVPLAAALFFGATATQKAGLIGFELMRQTDKNGNKLNSRHWTKAFRETMETAAWKALKPSAQALYPWLKFEWRGPTYNNNGRLSFSIRQAAKAMGVNQKTAMTAFHDLQRKGFVVVTKVGCLGVEGMGKSHEFELTEIETQKAGERVPAKFLFRQWSKGNDFPVAKAQSQK